MSKLGKKIQTHGCVFLFSVGMGKKHTEIKKARKGSAKLLFLVVKTQDLWYHGCYRVLDLKLPNSADASLHQSK